MEPIYSSKLPPWILYIAGACSVVAVAVSAWSISLQLKNYRKPGLQRMVVRIMVMVPVYAIASLVSLHSLEAAFVIDALRDIYEAFVIYCFFQLLLTYLGGERSLLIMLLGRPPKEPVFPLNLFKREIDVSDPYTFLFLKRGIIQYVQIKPILAAVTLILKACGKYNEGNFRANSGYLYVSIIYNASICTSLYCLGMFWVCVNDDLKPFRPVPKFLCVKGILFFSFWQSVGISTLVAAHVITRLGPYDDPEHVSTGFNNILICAEMPIFAFAHMFAFSYRDYIDPHHTFVARMPAYYALRDAFGLKDVVEDSKATLRGEGMDYREFEPAEGHMHQGEGRDRRIKAGLRYSQGGKRKYWLPQTVEETRHENPDDDDVYAPLFVSQAENVVHLAPDMAHEDISVWDRGAQVDDGYELPFGGLDEGDEELYEHSRKYLFGDYNYPCVDISSEGARITIWDEEERVLRNERSAWYSPIGGPQRQGYGAVQDDGVRQVRKAGFSRVIDLGANASPPSPKGPSSKLFNSPPKRPSPQLRHSSVSSRSSRLLRSPPPLSRSTSRQSNPKSPKSPIIAEDAVDLVVEDPKAAEADMARERRKGEPAMRTAAPGLKRVYGSSSGSGSTRSDHDRESGNLEAARSDSKKRQLNLTGEWLPRHEEQYDERAWGDGRSDGEDEAARRSSPWSPSRVDEPIVAREQTPPPTLRVSAYHFDGADDNPTRA